jgi:hypothetical protein
MQCLQWNWIQEPITLLATALPAELMEISTNTVSRGDYEPITVPITLVQQDGLLFHACFLIVTTIDPREITVLIWEKYITRFEWSLLYNWIWHIIL